MSYLTVIPLADAKEFLRIDAGNTADDARIQSMINAACLTVEKETNHILFARDSEYLVKDGSVRVFDFPINSVSVPANDAYTKNESYLSSTYCPDDSDLDKMTLNVGYALAEDVPETLKELIYEYLDLFYYGNSKDGRKELSEYAKQIRDQHRRFVL